ncbi:hypothetical protein D3C86_957690 [compost metagenome]
MVPQHFDATMRDRKRVVTRVGEVQQAIAAVGRLGVERTFLCRIIDILRVGGGAVGFVHRDPVGVGVALEHGHLTFAKLGLVLFGIGRGDSEQRLLACKWVAHEQVGHRRRIRLQSTGPGRNAPIGIAFLLAAKRSQAGTQLGGFLRRNCRHRITDQKRQ